MEKSDPLKLIEVIQNVVRPKKRKHTFTSNFCSSTIKKPGVNFQYSNRIWTKLKPNLIKLDSKTAKINRRNSYKLPKLTNRVTQTQTFPSENTSSSVERKVKSPLTCYKRSPRIKKHSMDLFDANKWELNEDWISNELEEYMQKKNVKFKII